MSNRYQVIAKKYRECNKAIQILKRNGIIDDELHQKLRNALLDEIIQTFEIGVEE